MRNHAGKCKKLQTRWNLRTAWGTYASTFLLYFFVSANEKAAAQSLTSDFQTLYQRWNIINSSPPPKDFKPILGDLRNYRATNSGKSWQVDYMLGVAYCRTKGAEQTGAYFLQRVTRSLQTPASAREAAAEVVSWCGSSEPRSEKTPDFRLIAVSGLNQGGVFNKGGYEMTSNESSEVNSTEEKNAVPINWAERLFSPEVADVAVEAANERVEGDYLRGGYASGFVIEVQSGTPAAIGTCLARYRTPLENEFGMKMPDKLITIYAMVGQNQIRRLALKLHGVQMPLATVAYSVAQDLSIVGIGTPEHCGTLAHELTHLAIHQNFGDSPAWLEEGLASEVAVASPVGANFRLMPSWRDAVLRRNWNLRPHVSQLLSLTWGDFTTNSRDTVEKVAATHAMAASFVRYLDARHKLVAVYTGLRGSLASEAPASDKAVVESAVGQSVDQIDADFVVWFREQPSTR
jgi:hypothetical protein